MDSSANDSTPPRRPAPTDLIRKAAVAGVGGTVTAAGLVMLVTPGPGIVVSLAGLAILAREFPAAGAQLERLRGLAARRRRDED